MTQRYFFGYGSLVNRRTHSFENAHPARISGWRRAWCATDLRKAAFLTVQPDESCTIDGLIAQVPGQDWAGLDQRERAYERICTGGRVEHALPHAPDIHIYAIAEGRHAAPTRDHPILLSYLDVVIQGYLDEFGERGVKEFVATTDGWQAPILDDRAAPIYPRSQRLEAQATGMVDALLRALSADVQKLV